MKVQLVANTLTHYRLPLYVEIQSLCDLQVVFFSDGGEWYWARTEQPSDEALKDAIHLRGFWLGRTRWTPGLFTALFRSRPDVIIKDPNGKFALPVTYCVARLRGIPFVFWASLWRHPETPIHRISRPLLRHIYKNADAIITYGNHVSRYVIGEGANSERVFVAPQAIQPLDYGPDSENDEKLRWGSPVRLLFVGRLERWKGVDILLRAVATLPPGRLELRVVGEGSEAGSLRQLSSELGLDDRVEFLGKVPNAEIAMHYRWSSIVVVPSRATADFAEPWALVVNEAMGAGSVVLASTAVGAVMDGLVEDGQTGYTFKADDVTNLSALLERLTDPADEGSISLKEVGKAGRNAISTLSIGAAAKAFLDAAGAAVAQRGSN